MGFNCLKARAISRRQFTFYHYLQVFFSRDVMFKIIVLVIAGFIKTSFLKMIGA